MIGIHLSELRLLNRNFTIYLFHMEQDQSYDKDERKVQWNSVYSNLSY